MWYVAAHMLAGLACMLRFRLPLVSLWLLCCCCSTWRSCCNEALHPLRRSWLLHRRSCRIGMYVCISDLQLTAWGFSLTAVTTGRLWTGKPWDKGMGPVYSLLEMKATGFGGRPGERCDYVSSSVWICLQTEYRTYFETVSKSEQATVNLKGVIKCFLRSCWVS